MGIITILKKVKDILVKASVENPAILDKIKVGLGEVMTDKGEPILFEGDVLAEQMPVFTLDPNSGAEVPVPDGTYTMETGEVIDVQGGVCVKITPAATPAASADGSTPPPATAASDKATATPKQTIERHEIESYFKEAIKPFEDKIAKLEAENVELKAKNTELDSKVIEMGEHQSASPAKSVIELANNKPLSAEEIRLRNIAKLRETTKTII